LLFADELTGDLLGEAYADSAIILVILSLGYTTNAFFGFNGMTLNVFRAIGFIVTVNILAVAANIGLNLAFIPAWGPVGAAAATAATYVIHNLARQYGLVRKAGVRGFNRTIGGLYATALAGAAVAVIAGPVLGIQAFARIALVPLLAIVVALRARHVLSLDDTFPIVSRLPLIKRLARTD
jgi:O-antigen/teichoic acid export membrane protein